MFDIDGKVRSGPSHTSEAVLLRVLFVLMEEMVRLWKTDFLKVTKLVGERTSGQCQ